MTPSDEEIANFATLQRTGVLAEIVKLAGRLPVEFWGDVEELLEAAEKRGLSGQIDLELHHDSRGRVGKTRHRPDWHRQGGRRIA